jgi:hypothetical protein
MSRASAACLLATGAAAAALWLGFGTGAELPESPPGAPGWAGDFLHYYHPNAAYAGARLARGEIPLWNPDQGLGGPFLATLQPGVLYPPNWLHAVLPTQTAFVAIAALHVALGVWLAGGLASALGAGALAAAAAGVAYATSFNAIGSVWTPPVQYATSWAPGILWAVDRLVARPSPRRTAALAACVALALLTGWPYVVAMSALAAALYAAALLAGFAWRERRVPLRPALALALGVAGGFALAAPQLLPSGELLARSVRALGTLVEGQAIWVSEPHEPGRWFRFFEQRGFNDAIPGLAALALSSLALVLPGPGRLRLGALLCIGALGILISFPNHTPVFHWLREIPLLGDFRFPYRYRLLMNLALAIGAGVGADHLARLLGAHRARARAAGALALAACAVTTLPPALRAIRPFPRSVPERPGLAEELAALGVETRADGLDRVYWLGRSDKLGAAPGAHALHDLEPITLASTAQLVTFFETGRALTLATVARAPGDGAQAETLAAPFYGFLTLPETGDRAAILDLVSARWIVSERALGWLERRYRRASAAQAERVAYENPAALPRAYRVERALPEPVEAFEALQQLAEPRFPRRRLAFAEDPPRELVPRPGAPVPRPSGEVEVRVYEPERVVLRTAGERPALVILTDAGFPGWQARVDGAPARVRRANFALRAVAVDAGEHEIELRYRPTSFRLGAALALAAALACGAAAWRRPRV